MVNLTAGSWPTLVLLIAQLVASFGHAGNWQRRRSLVNASAVRLADESDVRVLNPAEFETVSKSQVAEARLLRLCILAMERGESRSWLQLPPIVAGWPRVHGATHPMNAALRAYAMELQRPGPFNRAAYLDSHGRAGYDAEVLLHWPALRDGMRVAALERGISVDEVESSRAAKLAEAVSGEGPSLSVDERVRRALELGRRGRIVSGVRIVELGQSGIDAFAMIYGNPGLWPEWAASGPDRRFFVSVFLDTMIAWGDNRWTLVAPPDWSAMGASHETMVREDIVCCFGKTWPELTRESLALEDYAMIERELRRGTHQ